MANQIELQKCATCGALKPVNSMTVCNDWRQMHRYVCNSTPANRDNGISSHVVLLFTVSG